MAKTPSLQEFLQAVHARMHKHPSERYGQACFNTLYFDAFDPEFAESIRGGQFDPFYDDDRVDQMLLLLKGRWT